jgi:anaerobic selenocysteine-containing dehydrogenase
MAATIVRKAFTMRALRERVAGKQFRINEQWSPEQVADTCGVEAALIRKAARLYAQKSLS